jgi:hypothetical protein
LARSLPSGHPHLFPGSISQTDLIASHQTRKNFSFLFTSGLLFPIERLDRHMLPCSTATSITHAFPIWIPSDSVIIGQSCDV